MGDVTVVEKRDPRLDDPGVIAWLHTLQRTLEIQCQLRAEGKPSMKLAVEYVIMPEFGIDHSEARHIMNVIEWYNMLVPADVEKAYKIKLD